MWALAGLETLHLLSEHVFKMNGEGKTTAWRESHPSRDQNHRAGPENQYVRAKGVGWDRHRKRTLGVKDGLSRGWGVS